MAKLLYTRPLAILRGLILLGSLVLLSLEIVVHIQSRNLVPADDSYHRNNPRNTTIVSFCRDVFMVALFGTLACLHRLPQTRSTLRLFRNLDLHRACRVLSSMVVMMVTFYTLVVGILVTVENVNHISEEMIVKLKKKSTISTDDEELFWLKGIQLYFCNMGETGLYSFKDAEAEGVCRTRLAGTMLAWVLLLLVFVELVAGFKIGEFKENADKEEYEMA